MRKHRSFSIAQSLEIKDALLEWSKKYSQIVWLDSNGHTDSYGSFDSILAVSQTPKNQVIKTVNEARKRIGKTKDWLFGYLSYDLKNDIENLSSSNFDGLDFPKIYFFQPSKIIQIKDGEIVFSYLEVCAKEIEQDYIKIKSITDSERSKIELNQPVHIKMRIHKDAYFDKLNRLLGHIHRGDIYEANFCQEFYSENTEH